MIQFDSNIFPQTKGAYITGGSIRDLLLGRTPSDYDIAVLENPAKFAGRMAAGTQGHLVTIGKPGKMITRVIADTAVFDISPVYGASIEAYLFQRDFTINAMAYDLSSKEIIDPLGGQQDLVRKEIRMVSNQIFLKDPIRLIRAFRMGACLDFKIEPGTAMAIADDAALIQESAGERIRAELFKMLETQKSHDYLLQMVDTGLLFTIFPELSMLKGCFQNRYHRYDVFEHSIKAYCQLETILSDLSLLFPATWRQIIHDIDPHKTILLKFAVLLHDIGKPEVKSLDNKGNTHFYGHAKKSADLAKQISQRLKFSTRERDFLDFIIRNHIRPLSLFIAYKNKTLTNKGLTRFFMKCKNNIPYLLLHTVADFNAKQVQTKAQNKEFITFLRTLFDHFFAGFQPRSKTPPLVTGYDLIDEFGLTPSPLFKKILKLVEEARLSNTIDSKPAALKLIREFLRQQENP